MAKKTEFQVTIGYKAVVTFNIKTDNAEQAKNLVLAKIKEKGIYEGQIDHETQSVAGVVNLDDSWNMLD